MTIKKKIKKAGELISQWLTPAKTTLTILLILIPFHKLIERFISKTLVKPILSEIASSWPNNLIAIAFIIYLSYSFYKSRKRNIYISKRSIVTLSSLFLIYIYYRFFAQTWTFTQFYGTTKISYTDTIIVCYIFELLKKILYKNRIPKTYNKDGFLIDLPLDNDDKDTFNRAPFAKTISKKITQTNNTKCAFAIGINGEWGVGKTSFIKLIEINLPKPDYIILNFNPWLNNGAQSIINDFFKILSTEVNKYNTNLSTKIEHYGQLLLQLESSNLNKLVKPILNINKLNNAVQTEYSNINNSISTLGKKIIIFIDDLDRLDNEEIIEVIRIIRNTGNFPNTIFVAAYDRSYLVNALTKINSHNSEYFLEKIFQVEVHLPEYPISTIKQKLYLLLKDILIQKDKADLKTLLIDTETNSYSSPAKSEILISTMRDVTRFSNSLTLSYAHLKGEVNIRDLYHIELLKLKFPAIYNLILKEKDKFLTLYGSNMSSYVSNFYSLRTTKKDERIKNSSYDNYTYIIEEYLERNPQRLCIGKQNIETIISILKQLFPDKGTFHTNELAPLSIAEPDCFSRYSFYRLTNNNLSENEFKKYFSKSQKEFSDKINEWVKLGMKNTIQARLKRFNKYADKQEYEKVILSIFTFARIPIEKDNYSDCNGYDKYDLRNKIDISNPQSFKQLYGNNKDEHSQFIKRIFADAPPPYLFESNLIYDTLKTSHISDSFLSTDFIETLLLNYFRNYTSLLSKIDIKLFWLYHSCYGAVQYISAGKEEAKDIQNNNLISQINNLFIEFISKKDLDGFLHWNIERNRRKSDTSKYFALSSGGGNIKKIFGSLDEFKKLLDGFNESEYTYLSEFKEFYKECKKVNFEKYVEFEFKSIKPN